MKDDGGVEVLDWHRMFYSDTLPIAYLGEIALRTTVMFLILIIVLKFLSKRGVKQLSVFELAILIALGSATGDPMFYHNIPVTYGIVVLVLIIVLYRIITGLTGKSKTMEKLLEGKPTCLLADGKIEYANYKKVGLPYDKFFAELRMRSVDHLGQVKKVYLETSGELSIYLFEDEAVRPGLPIYPESIDNPIENIDRGKIYACMYCGHVQQVNGDCATCQNHKWLLPQSNWRVH